MQMIKTLIFESGRSGYGGSFKCCWLNAVILKRQGYQPSVISVNDSIYWKSLNQEGIKTKIILHRFCSNEIRKKTINKKLRGFSRKITRRFPNLSIFCDSLLHFIFIKNLKKYIISEKIKLVHTNTNFINDMPVYKAAYDLKLPLICHLRSMPQRRLTPPEQRLSKYRQSCFIAVSKATLKEWVKAGIPEYKIKLIYDSLPHVQNVQRCNKDLQNENDNNIYLLYVGRLEKRKSIHILIKALLAIRNKNWKLSIVGDGFERKNLERMVKENGLSEKVAFFGFQKSVEKFYKSHDILIAPSLHEALGMVILEAMQFGIAVIGSKSGGIPEIIENDDDGILFETDDICSLRNAIENLINDQKKRIQIGLNGMKKVENIFSEKIFTEKIIEIYIELLK